MFLFRGVATPAYINQRDRLQSCLHNAAMFLLLRKIGSACCHVTAVTVVTARFRRTQFKSFQRHSSERWINKTQKNC